MSDEVTRQAAELRADRDAARAEVAIVIEERDAARAEITRLETELSEELRNAAMVRENRNLLADKHTRLLDDCAGVIAERDAARDNLEQMIGKVNLLMAERDAALVEVRSQVTEIRTISVDRDSAEDHNGFLREKCQKLEAERDAARAEAEGLRADLLAHPPETHTELAAERQRHLELMEDYDRREVVITTLEDALKRAENALTVAQGQHIDDRLKGFLAVISQLADQAQDLIP